MDRWRPNTFRSQTMKTFLWFLKRSFPLTLYGTNESKGIIVLGNWLFLKIGKNVSELNSQYFIQQKISVHTFLGKGIVNKRHKQSLLCLTDFFTRWWSTRVGEMFWNPPVPWVKNWHKRCRLTIYKRRNGIDFVEAVQRASGHKIWGGDSNSSKPCEHTESL